MTTQFLELIQQYENMAKQPIKQHNVLFKAPYWYSVHNKALMNCYNNIVYSNVLSPDIANKLIKELS